MPKGRFEPDGIEIEVPIGTSILESSQKAGAQVGSVAAGPLTGGGASMQPTFRAFGTGAFEYVTWPSLSTYLHVSAHTVVARNEQTRIVAKRIRQPLDWTMLPTSYRHKLKRL